MNDNILNTKTDRFFFSWEINKHTDIIKANKHASFYLSGQNNFVQKHVI